MRELIDFLADWEIDAARKRSGAIIPTLCTIMTTGQPGPAYALSRHV
jgi:hypothetical protein